MNFIRVNIMIPTNLQHRYTPIVSPNCSVYKFSFSFELFLRQISLSSKQMSRLAKPTNAAIPNEIVKNFDIQTKKLMTWNPLKCSAWRFSNAKHSYHHKMDRRKANNKEISLIFHTPRHIHTCCEPPIHARTHAQIIQRKWNSDRAHKMTNNWKRISHT